MKKSYKVPVCRISYSFLTIEVEADNEEAALALADDEAGDHSYSEKSADYTFPDGAIEIN